MSRSLVNLTDALGFNELSTRMDSVFNKIMGDFMRSEHPFASAGYPKVDVYDSKNTLHIDASVPGLTKEDVKVEWAKDLLTISASKAVNNENQYPNYHLKELHRSSFSRTFSIPKNQFKVSETVAEVKDGILYISIPRLYTEEKEINKITVK